MLGCSMVCDCIQDLRQVLDISGGTTESIFPKQDNRIKCLKLIASQKTMSQFRSIVDVLFCAAYPSHIDGCFAFYNEKGRQLKYLIDMEERESMENEILDMLEEAWISFKRKEPFYYAPSTYIPKSTWEIERQCRAA
jgi:hypothetical protein